MDSWLFYFFVQNKGVKTLIFCHVHGLVKLLIAFVTHGEPTLSNFLAGMQIPLMGLFGRVNDRLMIIRPGILPRWFFVNCISAAKIAEVLWG